MPSLLEQLLGELVDTAVPIPNASLAALSGLSSVETDRVMEVWASLDAPRRRQVLFRLLEMAEDDVTLDFEEFFRRQLNDTDPEVRRQAIGGLWESESTTLINVFIKMLRADPDISVQAAAAQALGKYTVLVELGRLREVYRQRLGDSLLQTFQDPARPTEVKRRALEALAPLDLPEVREAIAAGYRNHDRQMQISALYAMGVSCRPEWADILRKELGSDDAEIRYEAVTALGEIGLESDTAAVAAMTDDDDVEVALAAVRALGEIGGDDAKRHLERYREDPRETVRQAAVQTLAEMVAASDPLSFQF